MSLKTNGRAEPSGPNGLPDSQKVSFAVAEPRGPFAGTLAGIIPRDLRNSIDGRQAGQVVLLKLNPPRAKLAQSCLDLSTSQLICVCMPDCTPAETKIANSPAAQT